MPLSRISRPRLYLPPAYSPKNPDSLSKGWSKPRAPARASAAPVQPACAGKASRTARSVESAVRLNSLLIEFWHIASDQASIICAALREAKRPAAVAAPKVLSRGGGYHPHFSGL